MNDIDTIIARVRRSLSDRSFEDLGRILLNARKASRTAQTRGRHAASLRLDMVWALADQAIAARLGR